MWKTVIGKNLTRTRSIIQKPTWTWIIFFMFFFSYLRERTVRLLTFMNRRRTFSIGKTQLFTSVWYYLHRGHQFSGEGQNVKPCDKRAIYRIIFCYNFAIVQTLIVKTEYQHVLLFSREDVPTPHLPALVGNTQYVKYYKYRIFKTVLLLHWFVHY